MTPRSSRSWLFRAAIALLLGFLALAVWGAWVPLESRRIWFVVGMSGAMGAMILAWWLAERRGARLGWGTLFAVAILARLLAFPLPPGLTDDVYRYLWDGWLQVEGIDPFAHRPGDAALGDRHDTVLFEEMNSQGYYSVYPPASQIVFRVAGHVYSAAGLGAAHWTLKGIFAVAELLALLLLVKLVRRPHWLLLYAWNPLVVIETWGQTHTEALALAALVLCLWAWRSRKPGLAVAALTVAGWVKLFPLLLLPFLIRRVRRGERWKPAAIAFVLTILLWLPYFSWEGLLHIQESTNLYMLSFEFNAGPYYLLKLITTAPLRWVGLLGEHQDTSKVVGPLMRVLFLAGVVWLWRLDGRGNWSFEKVTAAFVCLFLMTFVNLHPWYFVFVLVMLPVLRRPAWPWIWLSTVLLGTYLIYLPPLYLYWPFVWLGWGGAVALYLISCSRFRFSLRV